MLVPDVVLIISPVVPERPLLVNSFLFDVVRGSPPPFFFFFFLTYEPRCEKTGLRGFLPGPAQTGLYSHRRWLET